MSNHEDIDARLKKLESKLDSLKNSKIEKVSSGNSGINGEKVFAEMIAGLLFGLVIGYFLDDYFNTKPLFLIILVILGLAGSIYNIYKEAVKETKQEKE